MPSFRRHVWLLLRLALSAWACIFALSGAELCAQPLPRRPGNNASQGSITPLPAASEQRAAPQPRVLEIRIIGNRRITREKVLSNIGTKIDRPFDEATYAADVKKLVTKNWFVDVRPKVDRVPGGAIITFEVVERPIVEHVRFIGAKKIKPKKLEGETNIKKGDSLDPFLVTEGRQKIETLYQTKGFNDVKVTILEGDKPGDQGVVYLIHESRVQKIWKVRFEGNSSSIAPDGKLKTLVQSKPPTLWIFKGQVDRKKIEEDVEKLSTYYRGLGFFKAHVGRDYEFNEKEDWMTLVFYIDEGPRYKVRSISFIGNQVYPQEALSYDLKLKEGSWFNQAKMDADVAAFKDLYGSQGYVLTDALPELKLDLEPGPVDIVYQIKEGNQYHISDIHVQIKGDNPHTRFSTVLNRMSIRPGDLADIRQFRSSERRLKASGLYNTDPTKGDVPRISFSAPDSEDGVTRKKRSVARGNGDPDSHRGQSPDGPATQPGLPRANGNSARPPAPAGGELRQTPTRAPSSARAQSPDGGYGGRAVNPIAPQPQPYSMAQPPSNANSPYARPVQYNAPPVGAYPGYSAPQAPAYGAPPAGYGVPGQSSGGAPGYSPAGQNAPVVPFPSDSGVPPFDPNSVLPPPPTQPTLPIDIIASEAQTGRFMFGAGVNSNAGLVGNIILDEQNFDWRRVPSGWEDFRSGRAFRGGGQKFRIEASPGTQVSRYLFSFSNPYLYDTPVSFSFSGYYFQRFYRDWTEQRAGGRVGTGYQFSPDLSGTLAFQAEDIRISNPRNVGVPVPDLNAVLGHSQLYTFQGALAHDTRDSVFLPTEGHYLALNGSYAVGSFQFPRATIRYDKHFLLHERPDSSGRHTLSFYNQIGFSGPDTPIYERFFAGGFSSLRGFQFRGASPMVSTVEVGGNFQMLYSVEYMFPITADDMLRAVAFVDFGTVEQDVRVNWDDFRVAPGVGLRVTIPAISVAPIALDFAFPVSKANGDLTQVFSFFVGVGH